MLKQVFRSLDAWCIKENERRRKVGSLLIPAVEIRVLGQTALLERKLKLPLFATLDVDAYANFDYQVMRAFEALLLKKGRTFDRHSNEIWMPKTTEYETIFSGRIVTGRLAAVEYVLASKAKMAPQKNRALLAAYLQRGPSEKFLKLAKLHAIDLEQFDASRS